MFVQITYILSKCLCVSLCPCVLVYVCVQVSLFVRTSFEEEEHPVRSEIPPGTLEFLEIGFVPVLSPEQEQPVLGQVGGAPRTPAD